MSRSKTSNCQMTTAPQTAATAVMTHAGLTRADNGALLAFDGERLRLFLDGALQFDSLDEYRYQKALVHPALSLARQRGRVLILGGGDGLALHDDGMM